LCASCLVLVFSSFFFLSASCIASWLLIPSFVAFDRTAIVIGMATVSSVPLQASMSLCFFSFFHRFVLLVCLIVLCYSISSPLWFFLLFCSCTIS
jgi:hypothetical protein